MAYNDSKYNALAQYNAERARGLMHTPEYVAKMAKLQEEFNQECHREIRKSIQLGERTFTRGGVFID